MGALSSTVLGLAAAGTCWTAASAQSSGPDVIVGELSDLAQYTTPELDPQAYAIGTTSCNTGDDLLQWVSFNANHPVIAQAMYRVSTIGTGLGGTPITRIEQIGHSWLKHGFLALAGSTCQFCPQNSPSGAVLGVGCSDPYSAGLNGIQEGLGPRSEVNPATGVFPFPISWAAFPDQTGDGAGDPPSISAAWHRRVRVARADMLAPGALYFVEGQYVAADDAAAGNKHNNASYRRIFVDSSSLGIGLVDSTRRTFPAIFAWRDYGLGIGLSDPAVTLTPIDVPGDGRFWLASRVVQTGATTWHYEYALHNLNSHRAAQSFSVTVGGGGSLSSPGHRNAPAHSGEIWDTAPWTVPAAGSPPGGLARWGTVQTPAANPRGNALRWGTMFTFWFDANRAPATGQATIALFGASPDGPASVLAAVPTPGGGTPVAPVNDQCSSALTIGREPVGFSTLGATGGTPLECFPAGGGSAQIVGDIWFRYVHAGVAGTMLISTCGSSFDTKLAVYAGAACPSSDSTAIACSDGPETPDPLGCPVGSASSFASVPVAPGGVYLIRVGGSPGAPTALRSGNGVLTLTPPPLPTGACCHADGSCLVTRPPSTGGACNASYQGDGTTCTPNPCPQPPPPANDLCANAQWIADGVPITATNRFADTDGAPMPCGNGGAKDVWYKYRPLTTGEVRISTDNAAPPTGGSTDFDTVLGVYTACGGQLLDCDDDSGQSPEVSSDINGVMLTAGQTYLIRVAAFPYTDEYRQFGVFTVKVFGGGGTVPASGACCTGTACAFVQQDSCTGGSVFQGSGVACGPSDNPTTCCRANFNQVGGVTIQDVFDFLTFYFFGVLIADINGDGMVSVQDVFDYLVLYFRGCE